MRSGKGRGDKGFVLIESLVSFSLVTGLLLVTLPFIIELFHLREVAKNEVELSRTLYEEALFWNREDKEDEWLSGYRLMKTRSGRFTILVAGEDGNEKKVEIQSVSWEE